MAACRAGSRPLFPFFLCGGVFLERLSVKEMVVKMMVLNVWEMHGLRERKVGKCESEVRRCVRALAIKAVYVEWRREDSRTCYW